MSIFIIYRSSLPPQLSNQIFDSCALFKFVIVGNWLTLGNWLTHAAFASCVWALLLQNLEVFTSTDYSLDDHRQNRCFTSALSLPQHLPPWCKYIAGLLTVLAAFLQFQHSSTWLPSSTLTLESAPENPLLVPSFLGIFASPSDSISVLL